MSAKIYIEGGGDDSKELHVRCREGFRKLLESCGFVGRMPRLVACGGRGATFADFSTAHAAAIGNDYIAMLIDSEDPIAKVDATWAHLKRRDGWNKPDSAVDEQVLLMTTCMETWIVTDRQMMADHYGADLQENALPSHQDMESRNRHSVQDALVHATRTCKSKYTKDKKAFELVAKLNPATLRQHLASFRRCERILNKSL